MGVLSCIVPVYLDCAPCAFNKFVLFIKRKLFVIVINSFFLLFLVCSIQGVCAISLDVVVYYFPDELILRGLRIS